MVLALSAYPAARAMPPTTAMPTGPQRRVAMSAPSIPNGRAFIKFPGPKERFGPGESGSDFDFFFLNRGVFSMSLGAANNEGLDEDGDAEGDAAAAAGEDAEGAVGSPFPSAWARQAPRSFRTWVILSESPEAGYPLMQDSLAPTASASVVSELAREPSSEPRAEVACPGSGGERRANDARAGAAGEGGAVSSLAKALIAASKTTAAAADLFLIIAP